MFKSTLILLLALVATQGAQIHLKDEKYLLKVNDIIDDLIKEIEKLLNDLKNVVDEVVRKVTALYEELEKKIDDFADKVVDDAKKVLDVAVQKLLDDLEEIINDAGATNVTECVEKYEPEIKAIPDTLVDDIQSCVDGKVAEGKKIIKDALDKIDEVYEEIVNIQKEVEECGTGPGAAVCLANLIVKITEDIERLPSEILIDFYKVEEYVDNLVPELELCAAEQIDKVPEEGQKILDELRECVGL